MRVRDFDRERFVVHFEHGDVLELVPFLFADVNSPAGELVDNLIATKKRHRVARGQVENSAAQFLLCGRCDLHIEPETNRRATKRDPRKRHRNARNAHAVGAQRD